MVRMSDRDIDTLKTVRSNKLNNPATKRRIPDLEDPHSCHTVFIMNVLTKIVKHCSNEIAPVSLSYKRPALSKELVAPLPLFS